MAYTFPVSRPPLMHLSYRDQGQLCKHAMMVMMMEDEEMIEIAIRGTEEERIEEEIWKGPRKGVRN